MYRHIERVSSRGCCQPKNLLPAGTRISLCEQLRTVDVGSPSTRSSPSYRAPCSIAMRRWHCCLKLYSKGSWLMICTVFTCTPRQCAVWCLTTSAGEKSTAGSSDGEVSIAETLGFRYEMIERSITHLFGFRSLLSNCHPV